MLPIRRSVSLGSRSEGGDGEDQAQDDLDAEPDFPEEQEQEEQQRDVKSKADLYRYFSGKGPNQMVLDFLEDRTLQTDALILVKVTDPIERQYCQDLDTMQKGPVEQGLWAAERARAINSWFKTALEVIGTAQSSEFARRLRLGTFADPYPIDSEDATVIAERRVAEKAVDLALVVAGRYIWAHLPFLFGIPQMWAVYLLPDPDQRKEQVDRLKEIISAVVAAEKRWFELSAADNREAKGLELVFKNIGWIYYQLSRECMALAIQSGYSASCLKCRRLAAKLYRGSSSTKHCLEDTFAHLQRVLAKTSSNKSMSNYTKWYLELQLS